MCSGSFQITQCIIIVDSSMFGGVDELSRSCFQTGATPYISIATQVLHHTSLLIANGCNTIHLHSPPTTHLLETCTTLVLAYLENLLVGPSWRAILVYSGQKVYIICKQKTVILQWNHAGINYFNMSEICSISPFGPSASLLRG